jgi:hypothetical protein
MTMLTPDSRAARIRAVAAMVAHIADYNHDRLALVFLACDEFALPVPPPIREFEGHLRRWSAAIQKGARP